ncbi:type IV pilus biogenesis protein PilM [Serratia odorifera]|uniref:type IV pilus biogenesis protein PilM n=1 Tax=Serratia odorifera TaxID=618 RepID=UPI0018E78C35|nr:pilus assembly protein PilM [Serratia odorifera]MBJ2066664.1 pilus assembly protein PilM [Serratia odorifera]
MFSQAWAVGLDIQSSSVRALAAQRRRGGWQLRHWWQQSLPRPILRDGYLDQSESLVPVLRQWRSRLPRHISLRIALPVQRVLQQQIPMPDSRLQASARNDYVTSQGLKQFPLDGQTLVLDYRAPSAQSATLLLTAARQQELQQWLHCLQQADLHPQVVDITPCALLSMAAQAGLAPHAALLHRLDDQWLWAAPRSEAFACGLLPVDNKADVAQALRAVRAACPSLGDKEIYYSSVFEEPLPDGALRWSPLSAFSHLQPPLPAWPQAFVLAGGLALRAEDG